MTRKSEREIDSARRVLLETLSTAGLNDIQISLFAGMLNALSWVRNLPNSTTLDRLLAGEPVPRGKDPTQGIAYIKDRLVEIQKKAVE